VSKKLSQTQTQPQLIQMETVNLSVKLGLDLSHRPKFMIRAFSKPLMKNSGAYHRAVAKLDNTRRDGLLTSVKRRLCDKDTDQVIEAFVAYVDAVESARTAKQLCFEKPIRVGFSSVTAYSDWMDACLKWAESNVLETSTRLVQYHSTVALLDLVYEAGAEKDIEVAYAVECVKRPLR